MREKFYGKAGENKLFEVQTASVGWLLLIKFEYTAPETLHHNNLVKFGFKT